MHGIFQKNSDSNQINSYVFIWCSVNMEASEVWKQQLAEIAGGCWLCDLKNNYINEQLHAILKVSDKGHRILPKKYNFLTHTSTHAHVFKLQFITLNRNVELLLAKRAHRRLLMFSVTHIPQSYKSRVYAILASPAEGKKGMVNHF